MAKEDSPKKEERPLPDLTAEKIVPVVVQLRDMVMQELSSRIAEKLSTNLVVASIPRGIGSGCRGCSGSCSGNCQGSCHGSCKGGCYGCSGDCSGYCKGDCAGSSSGSSSDVSIRDLVMENFTQLTMTSVESIRDILIKEGYPY